MHELLMGSKTSIVGWKTKILPVPRRWALLARSTGRSWNEILPS